MSPGSVDSLVVESLAGELGKDAVAVTIDLAESGAASALVERAVEAFGRLDIMVNNAGTTAAGPAEAETPARFERVLKLNLSAVFECCQAAAGAMLPASGSAGDRETQTIHELHDPLQVEPRPSVGRSASRR